MVTKHNPQLKVLKNGCTRLVFLIGRWAIKVPRFDYGWKMGLYGLLANMQEFEFSSINNIGRSDIACPVAFHIWGGWLVVMPRCEPLSDDEWRTVRERCPGEWLPIPVEYKKRCSFGNLNGRIVVVDYGS